MVVLEELASGENETRKKTTKRVPRRSRRFETPAEVEPSFSSRSFYDDASDDAPVLSGTALVRKIAKLESELGLQRLRLIERDSSIRTLRLALSDVSSQTSCSDLLLAERTEIAERLKTENDDLRRRVVALERERGVDAEVYATNASRHEASHDRVARELDVLAAKLTASRRAEAEARASEIEWRTRAFRRETDADCGSQRVAELEARAEAALKRETALRAALAADGRRDDGVPRAKDDALDAILAEERKRVSELETQNKALEETVADLRASLEREKSRAKDEAASFRSEVAALTAVREELERSALDAFELKRDKSRAQERTRQLESDLEKLAADASNKQVSYPSSFYDLLSATDSFCGLVEDVANGKRPSVDALFYDDGERAERVEGAEVMERIRATQARLSTVRSKVSTTYCDGANAKIDCHPQ